MPSPSVRPCSSVCGGQNSTRFVFSVKLKDKPCCLTACVMQIGFILVSHLLDMPAQLPEELRHGPLFVTQQVSTDGFGLSGQPDGDVNPAGFFFKSDLNRDVTRKTVLPVLASFAHSWCENHASIASL